jgi:hypothetical protein
VHLTAIIVLLGISAVLASDPPKVAIDAHSVAPCASNTPWPKLLTPNNCITFQGIKGSQVKPGSSDDVKYNSRKLLLLYEISEGVRSRKEWDLGRSEIPEGVGFLRKEWAGDGDSQRVQGRQVRGGLDAAAFGGGVLGY